MMMRDDDEEAETEAEEGGIILSDDPEEAWQLDMKSFPILKSILQVIQALVKRCVGCVLIHFFRSCSCFKVGKQFIVDPTREEALSCDSAFCVSVNTEGCIGSLRKSGFGFLQRSDLKPLLSIALLNE